MITSHFNPEGATGCCEFAVRGVVKLAIDAILLTLADARVVVAIEVPCPIHGDRVQTFAVSRGTTPAYAISLLRDMTSFIRRILWTDVPLSAQPYKASVRRAAARMLH